MDLLLKWEKQLQKKGSANVRRGFDAFFFRRRREWLSKLMNSRIGLNFRSGLDRVEQAVSLLGGRIRLIRFFMRDRTTGRIHNASSASIVMAHVAAVGTPTSSPHMISIHDRICIGISRFDEDFTRLVKRCNKWSRPLVKPQDQSLYLRLFASWPSCILRNKPLWMWSLLAGIGGLLIRPM